MDEITMIEQARVIGNLMPQLMRHLSAEDDHDPVEELPLAQLRVCAILYERGPRTMSALSRELRVTLSAMTQIADRLQRAEMITRQTEGTDRRVRSLGLTARGQELFRLREEARTRRVAVALARLPAKTRREAVVALRALAGAVAAARQRDALQRTASTG